MARLKSYYTLCPLIDQQSLLGVETDSSPGCAIVTLGKNIVIRYELQDLKQVSSWSSKERLTSQVIYDELSKNYIAVFNGKYIRRWQEDETSLDGVKKYKFASAVHTCLKAQGAPPILVLHNGSTASLDWGLSNRKTWSPAGILLKDEKLVACELIRVKERIYLGALVSLEGGYNYVLVGLKSDNYAEDADRVERIQLKRSSERMVGHVVTNDGSNACLVTLWSHGRLYSYPLTSPSSDPVPGSLISVLTTLNTKHPVTITPLTPTTIALYGADTSEEGACLLIYNLQFKLTQASQRLKLYTSDAKLWHIEDKLLLAANRHLGIAPFTLAAQRLEAMIGSAAVTSSSNTSASTKKSIDNSINNCSKNEDDDNGAAASEDGEEVQVIQQVEVAEWGLSETDITSRELPMEGLTKESRRKVETYVNEGLSDAVMLERLLPEMLEKSDYKGIRWCLEYLRDLPEELLIRLLKFCLRDRGGVRRKTKKKKEDEGDEEMSEKKDDEEEDERERRWRERILEKLLSVCYTDASIVYKLRTGLGFGEILGLMGYLIENFRREYEDSSEDRGYRSEVQFCEWGRLLLDSHYQNYLLSYDEEVGEMLARLREILRTNMDCIEDLETVRPVIDRVLSGKPIKCVLNDVNRFYSVEEVKLY